MQSLVSSLTPNILISFTICLSFVYLRFRIPATTSVIFLLKIRSPVPFRIGKKRTLPDWQKWDHSRLAKRGPFRIDKNGPCRIGKNGILSDWKKWDHSGLAKTGPFRIGKFRILPGWQKWDPSGLAKLGPFQIGKIRTLQVGKIRTLPDWQK